MKKTKIRDLKILLVDPDYDFLQVMSQFLNNEGFEIITAYDGEEGLNKALVESPDLVILEPMLSNIHGFTLCGMIATEFKKKIPVIIVTQHYEEAHYKKEAIRTHGASTYLVRPITKSELRNVINEVLRDRLKETEDDIRPEGEHPDMISDDSNEDAQEAGKAVHEKESEVRTREMQTGNQGLNLEGRLASEGSGVKKSGDSHQKNPFGTKEEPAKGRNEGAPKDSVFNKIREKLRSAIDKDEISSVNYKERSIHGRAQDNGESAEKDQRPDMPVERCVEQRSNEGNNGKESRKIDNVDKALDELMVEFGLSTAKADHGIKHSR